MDAGGDGKQRKGRKRRLNPVQKEIGFGLFPNWRNNQFEVCGLTSSIC